MATDFILAPNARWQGRDQTGQPVQGGKLYTYLNQTVSPKATYQDYEGNQPNTNPVILDGKGEANIYWATDDLYTIKLFTADDQEVYTQDNYPVVGTNTTRVVSESEANIARNNQFFYWDFGTNFSPVVGIGTTFDQDYICDDWYYKRVSTTYTVNITRQTFAIDQDEVPGNPIYYFRYQATTAPTGESNNRLYQTFESVQTLAGQAVTVGLYAKSPTASTINVYLVQNFGTGGSPSPEVATLVGQFDLTTSWEQYSGTITLPSMDGKTLGTAGNDELILRINFPNDVIATIDLCNIQFQVGDTLSSNFPFQSKEVQFQELVARIQDGVASTGDVKLSLKAAADPGWLLCDDGTIGNLSSGASNVGFSLKALYTLIWNNVSNTYAPIFTSAGAVSTRGATAEDDFNALKRLSLTKIMGRVLAGTGHSLLNFPMSISGPPTTQITIGNSANLSNTIYNATPVQFTTTGTLPAGLAPATTYYANLISASVVSVGTSRDNALAGTYVNITDTGTGVHTMVLPDVPTGLGTWSLGQTAGEQAHTQINTEVGPHLHTPFSNQFVVDAAASGVYNPGAAGGQATTTAPMTGTTAFNVMQPTAFFTVMIKI